jgi:DNA ligase-1
VNNLYEIIKSLQAAPGSIAKQAILDANKDNELFKAYMKAVYDVGINYYQKKLPKGCDAFGSTKEFEQLDIDMMMELAERKYTGHEALARLHGHASAVSGETRELLQYMLDRKIGASVGDTMVLKTWPDLYFIPPYQRCSLLDKKARERFGKLKRFYVQTKADGSFAYVVKRLDGTVDVITRQGSKYPQWFAEYMAEGMEPGTVLVGELLVSEADGQWKLKDLERKTANGLLNSALKDGDKFDLKRYTVRMEAWDLLTQKEFEAGKSSRKYEDRLGWLQSYTASSNRPRVYMIYTREVGSLEQAFAVYQEHLQRGLEGCIIKDPAALWKDGTSRDMVKLKIKFEVEMLCTGIYEGTGKYAGMMGGGYFTSKDGGIKNEAGSGFTDKQREDFWKNPELIVDQVCALEANDITQSKVEGSIPSLSLPIFCEVRYDKKSKGADTTEHIYAQLEAAKGG